MDCVPSAKTRRGPFSSSSTWRAFSAGAKPSSASEAYQTNASSSVTSTSAWPSPVRSTNLRLGSLHGTEAPVAETGLVVPGIPLFGEDARDAFAVQIDPLILRPIESVRKVLQTVGIDLPDFVAHLDLRVFELDGWHRLLEIAAVRSTDKAALGHGGDERCDRALLILELGRPDQVVGRSEFGCEVMKHQRPAAQAVGADFEPGSVDGEGILAYVPGAVRVVEEDVGRLALGVLGVVLAIVEYRLEQPIGASNQILVRIARCRVAVLDALQVAVGGAA